ncbi:MAG: hypothetical protein PHV06_06990 [bacterium]|nr:hypothetical protein [bacterium]
MGFLEIIQVVGIGLLIVLGFMVFYSTILMWLGAKFARIPKSGFFRAFFTTIFSTVIYVIVTGILSYIPAIGTFAGIFIGLIFAILVIKGMFDTNFSKALLVWLFHFIALILTIISGIVIVPLML